MGNKSSKKSSTRKPSQPNKALFKSNDSSCTNDDHKDCAVITRLSLALKYYQDLDIQNQQHIKLFEKFMNNVYKNVLDDYIHFVNKHGHQIEDIHNDFVNDKGFNKCQIANCMFTSRHHEGDNQPSAVRARQKGHLHLYQQTMDSIHFYIFHIYIDAGSVGITFINTAKNTKMPQLHHNLAALDCKTRNYRFNGEL